MGQNKDRNNESFFFKNINDDLLRTNNYSWDKPGLVNYPAVVNFYRILMLKYYGSYRKPIQLVRNYFRAKKWGWKDPRNTFTLPYWLKHFPNARVIHIYRNGIDVAQSLYFRNDRISNENPDYSLLMDDPLNCFDLWEKYLEQAFRYKLSGDRLINIKYEDLVEGKTDAIEALSFFLDNNLIGSFNEYNNGDRQKKQLPKDIKLKLEERANQSKWMSKLGYL